MDILLDEKAGRIVLGNLTCKFKAVSLYFHKVLWFTVDSAVSALLQALRIICC